jgi:NADH-quinone oxidoreductase E subunit
VSMECCCCENKSQVEDVVKEVLQGYPEDKYVLGILKDVQARLGYLSDQAIIEVARQLDLPASKVYGVATFYSLFYTEAKGEHIIRVCGSAPCYIKGADNILSILQQELGISVGETTEDNKFTLEAVSCLGVCGVAPAMMIDDTVFGNLTSDRVVEIITEYRMEE